MMRRILGALAVALVVSVPSSQADDKLAFLIPHLYGPTGLVVDSEARLPDGSTHSAHFNSAFQAEFTQFNVAIASQLTGLPIPTPASGFSYTLDPSLGLFTRSTKSFGPILSDRADTVGRHKLSFGVHYQRFTFDKLEGVDLGDVPAVFTHDNPALGGRDDVVTTTNAIDASVGQFTTYLNFGVSSWLDAAVAVPVVSTDLTVRSTATVQRIGTSANPLIHFFRDASGNVGNVRSFESTGSASGIGDVVLRLKARVASAGPLDIGLGVDGRAPTGDEMDLLGAGAWGVKPFLVLSSTSRSFSPHATVGYEFNGESTLAGDPVAGTKEKLPNQITFSGGLAVAVTGNLTLAADVIGRRIIDGRRLVPKTFTTIDGRTTFPDISFVVTSENEVSGAVGFKFNPRGRLLIDANLLFSLNDHGLRDTLTPLVGLEYSF
ncbi:MAG TPA: hypothetical protein VFK70_02595 [Vicinamibacteria bacterium]|nr:hypothetical protein [Vicinamibacteria bacterium]